MAGGGGGEYKVAFYPPSKSSKLKMKNLLSAEGMFARGVSCVSPPSDIFLLT